MYIQKSFFLQGGKDGWIEFVIICSPQFFLRSIIKNISFLHRNINSKDPPIKLHHCLLLAF
jgi:hypothetical protein